MRTRCFGVVSLWNQRSLSLDIPLDLLRRCNSRCLRLFEFSCKNGMLAKWSKVIKVPNKHDEMRLTLCTYWDLYRNSSNIKYIRGLDLFVLQLTVNFSRFYNTDRCEQVFLLRFWFFVQYSGFYLGYLFWLQHCSFIAIHCQHLPNFGNI